MEFCKNLQKNQRFFGLYFKVFPLTEAINYATIYYIKVIISKLSKFWFYFSVKWSNWYNFLLVCIHIYLCAFYE